MMNRKKYMLGAATIIIVAIGIYLMTNSTILGNINGTYTEKTTLSSDVSFSADAGDRIKFSFRSNIKDGNLDITLYDSEGVEVYKLDKARELETFFTLDKSGTYTLVSICNNFIGDFRIKVLTARQLDKFFLNLLD